MSGDFGKTHERSEIKADFLRLRAVVITHMLVGGDVGMREYK